MRVPVPDSTRISFKKKTLLPENYLLNTYSVLCVNTDKVLGFIGMEPELTATLDRREHDDAVHDVMFQLLTGPEEESAWEEELIPAIRSVEQFDRWMGGSIV